MESLKQALHMNTPGCLSTSKTHFILFQFIPNLVISLNLFGEEKFTNL